MIMQLPQKPACYISAGPNGHSAVRSGIPGRNDVTAWRLITHRCHIVAARTRVPAPAPGTPDTQESNGTWGMTRTGPGARLARVPGAMPATVTRDTPDACT